ncbi:hypothetical protein Ae201684P_021470 [Aphanomyces euteiches]|nr:hypothetical protein Ae201684P_021470 [Aphanomyces euteiches]
MTTERTWLDDLHLLIATDEQLQQELATVCELFDSDDSLSTVTDTTRRPETTTTAQSTDDDNGATKRKKRKPTYIRQQEEIRQLRQQVDHLTALLRARQTTDERTPPSEILPSWRKTAQSDFDFDLPLGADQTFTRMDPNTVYATFVQETSDCMECHSNMIRKHYREREMEVIVSRTVLDDAAVPVLPLSSDATRCRFTLLQHLIWPRDEMTLAESDMALVLHEIQHVCFVSTPQQRRGMLPVAAPIDLSHLPFPKMATFVERGRRFVRLLKGKINDAIQAYQDQRSLARIES